MITWRELSGFLRAISRIHLTKVHRDRIERFLRKDLPWEPLVALAEMEGVSGFLHHHLKDRQSSVPRAIAHRMRAIHQRNRRNFGAAIAEMDLLSHGLQRENLAAMVMQGLSLYPVYGESGLRPIGDVDLLVMPAQKSRLMDLLLQSGYRPADRLYPELLRKGELLLDIHTHVMNIDRIRSRRFIFPENIQEMWQRREPFFHSGRGLQRLSACDNFIVLCAHALKHSFSRSPIFTRPMGNWRRRPRESKSWQPAPATGGRRNPSCTPCC